MKRFIGNRSASITYLILFMGTLLGGLISYNVYNIDFSQWYIFSIVVIVFPCLFFISMKYEKNKEPNEVTKDIDNDGEVHVDISVKEKINNLIKAYWLSENRTIEVHDMEYVPLTAKFNDYIITIPKFVYAHKYVSVKHKDGTEVFKEVLDNDTYEKIKDGIFGEYKRKVNEKEKRIKQKKINKFNNLLNQQ